MKGVTVRTKEEIINIIKNEINYKGKSVSKIEKELNIGQGTISRWDKASPSLETILRLCENLEINMILYADTFEETETPSTVDQMILKTVERLLKSKSFTQKDKEILYKVLNAFI